MFIQLSASYGTRDRMSHVSSTGSPGYTLPLRTNGTKPRLLSGRVHLQVTRQRGSPHCNRSDCHPSRVGCPGQVLETLSLPSRDHIQGHPYRKDHHVLQEEVAYSNYTAAIGFRSQKCSRKIFVRRPSVPKTVSYTHLTLPTKEEV